MKRFREKFILFPKKHRTCARETPDVREEFIYSRMYFARERKVCGGWESPGNAETLSRLREYRFVVARAPFGFGFDRR